MIRCLALVVTCVAYLMPHILSAQPIQVRSGAHDDFARLVLRLPPGVDWSAEPVSSGLRIEFSGYRGGFDTSQVFRRIDKSFIADVRSTGTAVIVTYACVCEAQVFTEAPDLLVIDVTKVRAALVNGIGEVLGTGILGTAPLQLPVQGATTSDRLPEAPARIAVVRPDQRRVDPPRSLRAGDPALSVDAPERLSNEDVARLAELKETLARQVSGAATRGLLDPALPAFDRALTRSTPTIDTSVFPSPDAETVIMRNANLNASDAPNVRITSSGDLPSSMSQPLETSLGTGASCPDPAQFDVSAWAPDGPIMPAISVARSRLYSDLDRLDQAAASDLVRLLLHAGFGAEARQVLGMDPSLRRKDPGYETIADIIEYGDARGSDVLARFADCASPVALWAILSENPVSSSRSLNSDAALRALTALPIHLRKFIAPELSNRLLATGDRDGAAAALRTMERSPGVSTSSGSLARAALDMEDGKTEDARQGLANIVASNEAQSAEALIAFVESHLSEDTQLDPAIPPLLDAYALEMRDDPIASRLRQTHVIALAKSGQFDAAWSALNEARGDLSEDAYTYVENEVLRLLTRDATDVVFLEHVFSTPTGTAARLDASVVVEMAERLVDLGFAIEADTITAASPDTLSTDRGRIVRARIGLALDRPREAEAHLFEVKSAEADQLRAEARAMAGDLRTASEMFDAIGASDRGTDAAWLAEDWTGLVSETESRYSDVARLAASDIEDDPARDGMLGRASDALSESETARQIIEELLTSTTVDAGAQP